MVGAIIIGDEPGAVEDSQSSPGAGACRRTWAAVEALGKAPIARLAEDLKRETCSIVSVISSDSSNSQDARTNRKSTADLVDDCMVSYKREGFGTVLILRCGAYVELDAAEMLRFHMKEGSAVTRVFTNESPLDVWMVDPSAFPEPASILSALLSARPALYHTHTYVNYLQTARDFRRLVLDSFHSRCRLRPQGSEIKPGIWICDEAQIERSARLVAPAFIGRGVQISDECLITRGSNVESSSRVDFGTAVEDSSILSNSYVGIGLDLSHSIVDGLNLLNLKHNVSLEITDPAVIRQNTVRGGGSQSWAGMENSQMALSSAE